MLGGSQYCSGYDDEYNSPLYPFGFGLSYTDFQIETLWAGEKDGLISIGVQVENTGDVSGKEVVQVYFLAP